MLIPDVNEVQQGTMSILLVDNHPASLAAVAAALRHCGHHCMCATTAAEALSIAALVLPDAVIFERLIEDSAGLALRLRAMKPELRVIVMSTHEEPEGFREKEPIDAYLVKPCRLAEIQQALVSP